MKPTLEILESRYLLTNGFAVDPNDTVDEPIDVLPGLPPADEHSGADSAGGGAGDDSIGGGL